MNVVFSGSIYDKTTNQPLSNQIVNIFLNQNSYCWICSSYNLSSGRSRDDGHFEINTEFDSTLLQNNYIGIIVPLPSNYILYPEPVGPGINSNIIENSSVRFDKIDSVGLNNLNFGFYPKTLLHINLHRITPFIIQQPDLLLDFNFENSTSSWGILQSNINKDTAITINTSANIFTKIRYYKYTTIANLIIKTDSIKCMANGNNSLDIYY